MPIAERFELALADASECRLRFENEAVFLAVNFDNGNSYELGIELGERNPNGQERPFALPEILRWRADDRAAQIDGLQITNQDSLERTLRRLPNLLLDLAAPLLNGNRDAFDDLATFREAEGLEYAAERDLRLARSDADKAWRHRDFDGVVAAYRPFLEHLNPSERRRFDYATKAIEQK